MKGKVLVIEDNVDWQDDLRRYLERAGFYVEVASDVDTAINKIKKELFHFITIDMQLDKNTWDRENYEGWAILELIKKLRIQRITPAMVITAFENDYNELKHLKNVESLFFMSKRLFDKKIFIDTIEREVDRIKLSFFNDHRGH